jgi:hypothetical protein
MTKKTNEPSGWNPVFEFPLDDRNTIIIDGVKYKRVEEPKSPVEEAYKDWWGEYPGTEIWTSDDETRWLGFQAGYHFAYEEKVSQEPEEEPEELKTLYDVLRELDKPLFTDDVCYVVKEWMSQYTHNVMTGEYLKGYEECLTVLEENLK